LRPHTPEQYDGLGLSRLDASLIFERLAMGCTSTTAYLTIHNMVSWMLGSWLPAEVAEEWVPRLASGELLGSYCLTEPGRVPTPRPSRPAPCAMAKITSSTAARCSSRAPAAPTCWW
jgi:alkylation response protein AidB-like acyl-CoA dehydrogenase